MTYVLFVVGFYLLIKGANLLVDGASALAKKFSISDIVIGLSIVAFGTSAPELVVNILSSVSGNSGLVIGNVLGSNIANILLILGISAIIYPLVITKKTTFVEIPFSIFAVVLLGFLFNDWFVHGINFSLVSRFDGSILLFFFVLFMGYIFYFTKKKQDLIIEVDVTPMSLSKIIVYITLGLLGLTVGGERIVSGAVKLSAAFGISQSVIGMTIVALGTSLPELTTSLVAVMKKKSDIAIGNVVGSNIFNILLVLGISAVISPISGDISSNRDIGFTLFVSVLLFAFLFFGKKFILQRYHGWIMVSLYVVYMSFVVLNAI